MGKDFGDCCRDFLKNEKNYTDGESANIMEKLSTYIPSGDFSNLNKEEERNKFFNELKSLLLSNDKEGQGNTNDNKNEHLNGGKKSKKLPKKEILGKIRCIYKIPGDRKEYLKHKGKLITVKEYKKVKKTKSKK